MPLSTEDKFAEALVWAEDKAEQIKTRVAADPEANTKLELATGLVLCFLGGQFPVTFAFAEAFSQAGVSTLVEHGTTLVRQAKLANEAWREDDKRDDDADGVPDVKQQTKSQRELLARKLRVAYGAMDPDTVRQALRALCVCLAAAITAVQLRFARVLSLGLLLGDFVKQRVVEKYLMERIRTALAPEYHKWIPLLVDACTRLFATWVAFYLTSFVATVSAALAGGGLVLQSVNTLCANRNVSFLTQGPADEVMTAALVGFGVLGQTLAGQGVKTLFNLVCFPLAISEFVLKLTLVLNKPAV